MKLEKIRVTAKKSRNYQTYECTETILIEEGDDVEKVKREAANRCRKHCCGQFDIDETETIK